jgi:TonB family protein
MKKSVHGSLTLLFVFVLSIHILALLLNIGLPSASYKEFQLPSPVGPNEIKVFKLDRFGKKQIVQSSDSEKRDAKDKTFLSDKKRSFDRQTRARVVDVFKEGRRAKSIQGHGGEGKARARKGGPKKSLSLGALGATKEELDPFKAAAQHYSKRKSGKAGNDIQAEEDMGSVSSTNDYVEGLPLGEVTQLNTQEYRFYGFYHRIRQRLEQFWGRSIQQKAAELVRNGRNLALEEDLVTALQIVLDENGDIISINILETSGVKELDDAAVESFNEAGPFPNPPREMLVDGRAILEWGFVVET